MLVSLHTLPPPPTTQKKKKYIYIYIYINAEHYMYKINTGTSDMLAALVNFRSP
jgi:hypothetical protein